MFSTRRFVFQRKACFVGAGLCALFWPIRKKEKLSMISFKADIINEAAQSLNSIKSMSRNDAGILYHFPRQFCNAHF